MDIKKILFFIKGLGVTALAFFLYKLGGISKDNKYLKKEIKANEEKTDMLNSANYGRSNPNKLLNKGIKLGKRKRSNN